MSKLTAGIKKLKSKPLTGLTNIATFGQRDKLQKAYEKSGLRSIYEDNKSTILNTAAMGGLMLATGGVGGLVGPGTALGLTAASGVAGASRDKERKDDEKAAILRAAQEQAKADASQRVDDQLSDIVGDPNSPATGPVSGPGEPIPSINQPIDPVTGQPLPVQPPPTGELIGGVIGDTPNYGGAVNTGGQASKDQQALIDEAELAYKLQQEQAGMSKAEREKMLQEYADLVSQQQNRMLDENAPALYEDLNTRGLLRSSELGNAMGRERAKAAAVLQEQVGMQGLTDRDAYIRSLEDANTNYIQGRSGGIQRRFSLEDFARQASVAKDTGLALQPISTGTPSSKAGDAAMVSAGANVASAMKGK